jgi:hypothetical protein
MLPHEDKRMISYHMGICHNSPPRNYKAYNRDTQLGQETNNEYHFSLFES